MRRSYRVIKVKISTGEGNLPLYIYQPTTNRKAAEKTPAVLWIHGGGYATGSAALLFRTRALRLVKKYGAVVLAPEYRLSGKAPYPAGLEDCYAALKYLKDHGKELGCNPDQLMVGGESAGGGMTAALCMLARDRGEVAIACQMPLYPMIDNRDTDSSRNNHGISWDTRRNHAAWKLYLRNIKGELPPYAVPARQTDYRGLPPAYTFVGNKEVFYCETLQFIQNLKEAGVPAQVDVYPTGLHAFDMLLPFSALSRKAIKNFEEYYLYAVEHYFAPQKKVIKK